MMEDESNKCQICGLEFADADELETHALSHFGVRYVAKQFKCPHCSEGFVATSVDDLRQHIVSSHEKESLAVCRFDSDSKIRLAG